MNSRMLRLVKICRPWFGALYVGISEGVGFVCKHCRLQSEILRLVRFCRPDISQRLASIKHGQNPRLRSVGFSFVGELR